MSEVYVLEGWFGDRWWIEGIYADKESAESQMNQLWAERRSDKLEENDYAQGLCKFDYTTWELIQ